MPKYHTCATKTIVGLEGFSQDDVTNTTISIIDGPEGEYVELSQPGPGKTIMKLAIEDIDEWSAIIDAVDNTFELIRELRAARAARLTGCDGDWVNQVNDAL